MNLSALLFRTAALGLLSSSVFGLAGCSLVPRPQPDPTRYYVLTTPAQASGREGTSAEKLVVGVSRIEIAPYLNGKDMVVRREGNEITYNSFSRWAEPLTTSIGRLLSARLGGSEKVGRVYSQPFAFDVERDYDVWVRVLRCEGELRDGRAVASFSALVEVTEARSGGAVVLRKLFETSETAWSGDDYGKLALALSESVAALGDEIAAALPAK